MKTTDELVAEFIARGGKVITIVPSDERAKIEGARWARPLRSGASGQQSRKSTKELARWRIAQ